MCGQRSLSKPGDAREDLVGTLGPDERLRLLIRDLDELLDGALEGRDAPVDAAA